MNKNKTETERRRREEGPVILRKTESEKQRKREKGGRNEPGEKKYQRREKDNKLMRHMTRWEIAKRWNER
jgi:hypothetical protein